MILYPVDFPADAARIIINDATAGKLAIDKVEVAEAVWNLQGYAMAMLLGRVDTPPVSMTVPDEINQAPTTEQVVALLKAHDELPPEAKQNKDDTGKVVGSLIPPITPAQLLKWCLQILMTIL